MSIFSRFYRKSNNKKLDLFCEDAKNFIQVHFVRERDGDKYAFSKFTLKSDPERDKCNEWYEKHGNPHNFSEIVDIYLNENKLKASTLCNEYGLESRVFMQTEDNIRNVEKWEAIAVCLGLDLNISESRALLKSAGYALSNSSETDLAIRFCLENDVYLLEDVNYILNNIFERNLNQIA